MAPKRWMISDRAVDGDDLGSDQGDELTYWTSDGGPVERLASWRPVKLNRFRAQLVAAANKFPLLPPDRSNEQKHVSLFVHGYNNDWADAAKRYESIRQRLFEANDLGLCILYTWPSDGMPTNYLPDRSDARASAPNLATVLGNLYDWLLQKQVDAAADDKKACRAKTSLIAHSMGNYLLQNAMQIAWTRKNRPLLTSLLSQLLMVAADVDNDLFSSGEETDGSDGDAIANLSYRVTALYSGLDNVLGISAGLKHFGKRRLGRSGLDTAYPVADNVWDVDCTKWIRDVKGSAHSAYFESAETINLMRDVLRGVDRGLIVNATVPG